MIARAEDVLYNKTTRISAIWEGYTECFSVNRCNKKTLIQYLNKYLLSFKKNICDVCYCVVVVVVYCHDNIMIKNNLNN